MADSEDKGKVNPTPAAGTAATVDAPDAPAVENPKPNDKQDEAAAAPALAESTEPVQPGQPAEPARPTEAHIAKEDDVTAAPPKTDGPPAPAAAKQWGLEPPEILRHLSAEERAVLEKKMRRKIDLRILPMIIVMYILNYIDRNNIAAARYAGLEDDLNMDEAGTQFSVGSVIFRDGLVLTFTRLPLVFSLLDTS